MVLFVSSNFSHPVATLTSGKARSGKMDYDAMVMDQEATGPSVKISDVSMRGEPYVTIQYLQL